MEQKLSKSKKVLLSFSCFLLNNQHAHIDGLCVDDGIEWVDLMFNKWKDNQNILKIPKKLK